MLKFLEKTPAPPTHRTPLRYHPQKTYGNSYESPSQFQNKHSAINQQSYLNPFLKYEGREDQAASGRQCRSVEPRWTRKTNLANLESSKMHSLYSSASGLKQRVTHSERYRQEIATDPLRFRLVKGEFTEYLNKNHHYRSIGPLQGVERSDQRVSATKEAIHQQQESRMQQLTASNKFKSELYNTIKSNLMKNSSLLTQRNRIKKNREIIHHNFRKEIERRQKDTSYSFNLPHLEAKEEAMLLEQYNRRYKTEYSDK